MTFDHSTLRHTGGWRRGIQIVSSLHELYNYRTKAIRSWYLSAVVQNVQHSIGYYIPISLKHKFACMFKKIHQGMTIFGLFSLSPCFVINFYQHFLCYRSYFFKTVLFMQRFPKTLLFPEIF